MNHAWLMHMKITKESDKKFIQELYKNPYKNHIRNHI